MEKEAQDRKEKQQAENRKYEEKREAEIKNLEIAKAKIQPTIIVIIEPVFINYHAGNFFLTC